MSAGLLLTQGSANLVCPRVLGARPNSHTLIFLSEDNVYLLCELEKKTGPHVENTNVCPGDSQHPRCSDTVKMQPILKIGPTSDFIIKEVCSCHGLLSRTSTR